MVSSDRLMTSAPSASAMVEKNASKFAGLIADLFVSKAAWVHHQMPAGFGSPTGCAPAVASAADGRVLGAGLRSGLSRNAVGIGPPVAQSSNSTVWTTG